MFYALGSFLMQRTSEHCFWVTDHYDFDPSFRSAAAGAWSMVELPNWAFQLTGAREFDEYAGGQL
ncbi:MULTISPECIES: hypothetical protein [unclassified Amycolatopsis]|uniref:hypothetical protein n=1 Tax=unclassified Amycolatopsis TaxID=2618356 RepID=UPI000F78EB55|nr:MULTISPECIES: hypothetical protein [unclassified Amycolatopsis]